jgi:VWFA-related protein
MNARRLAAGVLATLLTAAAAGDLRAQSQPPARPSPVFRAGTELVLVNVIARDKSGQFVRDLKREDFVVLEDGKKQTIDRAEYEQLARNPRPADVRASTGSAGTEQPGAEGQARPAPAPNGAPPERPSPPKAALTPSEAKAQFEGRRLIVLFFDLSSMQPEEASRALDAAHRYVDNRLTPSDLVSVVTLSTTWKVAQDFTDNREQLNHVLDQLDPNGGFGFEEGTTGDADGTPDNGAAFTADETEINIMNTDRRLEALRALADALGGTDQKKSIVYFSGGMSQTGLENRVQIRAVIDHAVRANVAIYAADTRGLQAVVPGGEAQTASVRGNAAFTGASMSNQFDRLAGSQDTLVTLSEDTGGRAFLDSNDLGKVFDRVLEDTSSYYILGYSSTNTARDGKYRKITVKATRPGITLEYRAGYYAPRDFKHSTHEDREQQLMDALQSDLPPTDLHVFVAPAYFRLADTRFYVPLSVVVPGSDVPFAHANTEDRATLDILGMVLDEGRRPVGRIRDTVKLKVEGTTEVRRKTIQYQTAFELPPGSYRVKVAVRENEDGAMGAFESAFVIPDIRKESLKMSAVVVGTQLQTGVKGSDNPLVEDGTALVPSATHVVSQSQHLYVNYEVYEPHAATPGAIRLLTSLVFFRNGVRVYETPVTEADAVTEPSRKAAVFRFDLPASTLKPGRYTCQVNVIDDAAGTFAFPRLTLYVAK